MRYRKKPIVIEAILWDGSNTEDVFKFVGRDYIKELHHNFRGLGIKTLEGIIYATIGDYIIKGIQGEFYPCKPDIFHQTYEEVPNE